MCRFRAKHSSVLFAAALALCGVACGAELVINEFMARNDTTLTNASGAYPDWIELYNTSTNAIDIGGWTLTDDPGNLSRSVLPSFVLDPFGFVIVFASGSPTNLVDGEIQANFKLSGAGEYLALVRPDGMTIASAFAPEYPAQADDISFGLRPDVTNTPLVSQGSGFAYHVPVEGTLGTSWTAVAFNDVAWSNGVGPIGYDETGGYDAIIQAPLMLSVTGVYARYEFMASAVATLDLLTLGVRYDDGFVAYLNGTQVLSRLAPSPALWNSQALGEHPNQQAVLFVDFDISDHLGALRDGTNVLAIHAMTANVGTNTQDLLLDARLDADRLTASVSGEWRYFHTPTPGARNVLGEEDFVKPVMFDYQRGFYDAPFMLSLSLNVPEFDIHYTLDGSDPADTNAPLYTAPLPISGTTVVRARGSGPGFEPSDVVAHTYLFTDDIVQQSMMNAAVVSHPVLGPQVVTALKAIPSLSISTGPDNLFDPVTGIYTETNALNHGVAWERPASVEWINPDGSDGFDINCGLRIYGGIGREQPKKGFRLFFKGIYGPTKLNFKVFDDNSAVESFDTIILRTGGTDQFTRNGLADPFVRRSQIATGQAASHSAFVHLYLDGTYWGLYNPSERTDQAFGASYYGETKEQHDALNTGFLTGDSNFDTYNAMLTAIIPFGVADNAAYQALQGNHPDGTRNPNAVVHLDVENQIDYILCNIWAGTGDWPSVNWYAGGARTNSTGWKFFAWDAENSLRDLNRDIADTFGPHFLHSKLAQNTDYRLRFADHVRRHCFDGGALTATSVTSRYTALVDEVAPAIPADSARWGDTDTPGEWQDRQDMIVTNFTPLRTAIVLNQLRTEGLYPQIDAPDFNQYGGIITPGFQLTMTASNTITYTLDGTDPRELASGVTLGANYGGPITLDVSTWVKARARNGTNAWSALTEAFFVSEQVQMLEITELMVNPYAPTQGSPYARGDFEFVEVQNAGTETFSLDYVSFTDGIDFTFPSLALGPGEHAVVVRNLAAFASRYDTAGMTIAGVFQGALNDAGERIELRAAGKGTVLVSFEFQDRRGWPVATDGAGHSLIPSGVSDQAGGALDYGGNWRPSAYRGGSPGAEDPAPLRDLVINEIVAHTDFTNAAFPEFDSNDWLELFNTRASALALTNWFLSDDVDDLARWAIPPAQVIAAGGWITFDEVTGFHNPTNTGFGLNKNGETIFLSYLPGTGEDRVADAVRFKAQERERSLGRYPDGDQALFALLPTTNSANALPADHLVFTEIMYHPAPTLTHPENNTADEYLEIFNPLSSSVELWNADGTFRVDGGVTYLFPTNTVLGPKAYLVVVPFDPTIGVASNDFMATYGITNIDFQICGPFDGHLDNRGERVALERPQAADPPNLEGGWVIIDEVIYADSAPWPSEADGSGAPLQRVNVSSPGLDVAGWSGVYDPSPGSAPAKVRLTHPLANETFFIPFQTPVIASIDENQVVGTLKAVQFFADGQLLGTVSNAPYAVQLGAITNDGTVQLYASLEDDSGTSVSQAVDINVMTIRSATGAQQLTDFSAVLTGELLGPASAELTFYWGTIDGGTNAADWSRGCSIGLFSAGVFSNMISGLDADTTTYFRSHGRSGDHEGWSEASESFHSGSYAAWSNCMKIAFSGYDRVETLTNFPALVVFGTNIPGFHYGDFQDDQASDLRFTSGSDGSALNYEIEEWNSNGLSSVWVQVPTLAGSNDCIFARWGNTNSAGPPSQARSGMAWDLDYRSVLHLQAGLADATANAAQAVNLGSSGGVGIIGQCRSFDGTDDRLDPAIDPNWIGRNINHLTMSLWVKPDSSTAGPLFGLEDPVNQGQFSIRPTFFKWLFNVESSSLLSDSIVVGQWQLLALVLRDGSAYAHVNDKPPAFIGNYSAFTPAASPLVATINGGSGYYPGLIDEVRFAGVARSENWMWASYRTVAENDSFTTYALVAKDLSDLDFDQMPDSWENQHLGGSTGEGRGPDDDVDLDGLSNLGEYVGGTDPTNPFSFFAVSISLTGNLVNIWFEAPAASGEAYVGRTRYYALDESGILPATWGDLPGLSNILAVGQVVSYTNAPATNGAGYYRGRVWLSED